MDIIVKPYLTEKMNSVQEKLNRFGFIVNTKANKIEIKKAVESLYGVNVVSVNTIRYSGKAKSRYTKAGVVSGRTNGYKRAIVSLKDGETIDFFSNI